MKKVCIVTDSHCGISYEEAEQRGVKVLPMPLYIDDECFYEDITISREEFFDKLKVCDKVATSQASPADVMDLWREVLKEYETILHMPMSSGLSGACESSKLFATEEEFDGKVFVVDIGKISSPMHRAILDAIEMIESGMSAPQIKEILEKEKDNMTIYISLQTLEYLKRGGRISGATATIGAMLDIKPILSLHTGLLKQHSTCRGFKKAKRTMLEMIKNDLETKYSDFSDDEIYLLAATTANEAETQKWIDQIEEYFPGKKVLCDNLSLGVACHTGEGALGIGLSCKPRI